VVEEAPAIGEGVGRDVDDAEERAARIALAERF
jgi:hypothetical protein